MSVERTSCIVRDCGETLRARLARAFVCKAHFNATPAALRDGYETASSAYGRAALGRDSDALLAARDACAAAWAAIEAHWTGNGAIEAGALEAGSIKAGASERDGRDA